MSHHDLLPEQVTCHVTASVIVRSGNVDVNSMGPKLNIVRSNVGIYFQPQTGKLQQQVSSFCTCVVCAVLECVLTRLSDGARVWRVCVCVF